METTREHVEVGDEIYTYILSQEQGKPRESMEPLENSIQKSIAKHPASKSRKRDVAKTTNRKNRLEVAGYSIVVMEDIVIMT